MNIIVLCAIMTFFTYGQCIVKALQGSIMGSKIRRKRSQDIANYNRELPAVYNALPYQSCKDGLIPNLNQVQFARRPVSWPLENPSYYPGFLTRPFLGPGSYVCKRDTGRASDAQYPINNISQIPPGAQVYAVPNFLMKNPVPNAQPPPNSISQFVNGGELDNENLEHPGLNGIYSLQGELSREMATKNNIKVHCVKSGREEVICTHGNFTYRICLPEQFMNQDTVEGLVSSIYNNIELGRHSSFGIPLGGGGGSMQNQQPPGPLRDVSLSIANQPAAYVKNPTVVGNSPFTYHFVGNTSQGVGNQQEQDNQIIRLSIPIDSQSNLVNGTIPHINEVRGSDTAHNAPNIPMMQPKFQTSNLVSQPALQSNAGFSSGQLVPMNGSNYNYKNQANSPQTNVLNFSNGQPNQGNNGVFIASPAQRQDNQMPPGVISPMQNPNENVDQVNAAYSSKWYAKRSEGDQMNQPQSLPRQVYSVQPYQMYLTKRDIGGMDYISRLRRAYNQWCLQNRKTTTHRVSVNEGRTAACFIPKMTSSPPALPPCPCGVSTMAIPCQSTCPTTPSPPCCEITRCPPYQFPCDRVIPPSCTVSTTPQPTACPYPAVRV